MHRSLTRDQRRRLVAIVAIAALPLLLSGCFTGRRSRLLPELSTTGNADIDAVLGRLEHVSTAVLTAGYDAVNEYSGGTTAVIIAQSAPTRRISIVGDVAFVVDGSAMQTCVESTDECDDGLDATRTSDVQLTPDFYGTSATARLRNDAHAATGAPVASTEVIEGQTATCVAIPIPGDTLTMCAFDNGVLARLDAADVDLTMTSYSGEADETLWE